MKLVALASPLLVLVLLEALHHLEVWAGNGPSGLRERPTTPDATDRKSRAPDAVH